MRTASAQSSLFEPGADASEAELARTRMRGMIDRLAAATAPPWTAHMEIILDEGAFKRAMRLVPAAEAERLWAEFDAHMERLYAVWAAGQEPGG